MANSKSKGNTGEYIICDLFTEVFGKNFHRTEKSGARLGGANAKLRDRRDDGQLLQLLGDVQPPTGWAWVIESKNYAEFDFHKLLLGKETILWDWISQVRTDAKKDIESKETYFPHTLVWKITRRGSWMCLPHQHFDRATLESKLTHYFHYTHISNKYGLEDTYTIFDVNEIKTNTELKDFIQGVITSFDLQ